MITWLEVGNSKKRRGWMRPALQQKKGQHVFFRPLIFSVFYYLLPQKFVDLSNQMYIAYLSHRLQNLFISFVYNKVKLQLV
ncbi:hypothetical protein HMPREF0083_05204 [Aneurinibacillus aneurinilyticus ATCC 12856]|uniref:Uncharacterized protein n=1 Tax=Aneurinibacillus aneurinilyticus ATCC 12856 TaxID=649747 RepID=U1WWU7_ANEAE|nr:hypothetical protein HMPREF0083_05204 [Aneurinibacillus aneurinilyticus ATCC 12856]